MIIDWLIVHRMFAPARLSTVISPSSTVSGTPRYVATSLELTFSSGCMERQHRRHRRLHTDVRTSLLCYQHYRANDTTAVRRLCNVSHTWICSNIFFLGFSTGSGSASPSTHKVITAPGSVRTPSFIYHHFFDNYFFTGAIITVTFCIVAVH